MRKNYNTILLIDDDPDDRELLEEAFLNIDVNVIVQPVASVTEAMDYLEQLAVENLPCLVIIDYEMPELNGVQGLRLICQNDVFKTIPAVVWSTSSFSKCKEACEEIGSKAYFLKPHNLQDYKSLAREMYSFRTGN